MADRRDSPDSRLLRATLATFSLSVVAVAWNAAIDNHDVGDPAATLGHELAAVVLLLVAAVLTALVGVLGRRASGDARRTRTAFALLALGGLVQSVGWAWAMVEDTTTPHHESYDGFVIAGIAAMLTAVIWLIVLWRRRQQPDITEPSTIGRRVQRWGPPAYLVVFGSFAGLAVLAQIIGPEIPNAAAVVIILAAVAAWSAVRLTHVFGSASGAVTAPGGVRPERAGDQATRHYLAPAGEGRLARSWRLSRAAWTVLRGDRTLVGIAVTSAVVGVGAVALLFWLAGWPGDSAGTSARSGRLVLVSALLAWPLTFVATYLNVALAAAAAAALDGEHLTPRQALRVATGRLGQIAAWSLLAAGVGVLLQQIAERVPGGGRLASWIAGAAWGLVTFFAIPILALEGCAATRCVGRSAQLIKQRWGEGIAGTLTIGAWAFAAAVPAAFVLALGFGLSGSPRIVLLALGASTLVAISTFGAAVRQVFAVALYRYATSGEIHGAFPREDVERPFTAKRRWLRR